MSVYNDAARYMMGVDPGLDGDEDTQPGTRPLPEIPDRVFKRRVGRPCYLCDNVTLLMRVTPMPVCTSCAHRYFR